MAYQRPRVRVQFRYQNFTIDKTRRLGHGSYGAVYMATCEELPCAAKILHPTVLDPLDPGSSKIAQRFQQECAFMSDIRHPNITQYIGMDRDPETGCPVLLMELLDESLTNMLENYNHSLPYYLQVDISLDIALAVTYLHTNGVVHRDLSSNNVLILAKQRAKVTDFGMSRLTAVAPRMTPLTMCPGTSVYMPPEALSEPPTYTEKIDCFSEGVLFIQICTRLWPEPGPRTKLVPFIHSPTGRTEVPILEVERRKSHIDLIDPTHPLLAMSTRCLSYETRDRPSAQQICQSVKELKDTESYRQNRQESSEKDRRIDHLQTRLDDQSRQMTHKDIQLEQLALQIQEKDGTQSRLLKENQKLSELVQIKDSQIQAMDAMLKSKDRETAQANQQLQSNERISANVHAITEGLCTQFEQLKLQVRQLSGQEIATHEEPDTMDVGQEMVQQKTANDCRQFTLKWDETDRAPAKMYRGASITIGNMAYFKTFRSVYTYDSDQAQWGAFKDCVPLFSSMAAVNGLPTIIGGKSLTSQSRCDGKLVSLVVEGTTQKWVEKFPPMPTARCYSVAVNTDKHLIVAGGSPNHYVHYPLTGGEASSELMAKNMDTVEILDMTKLTWSKAANLPTPYSYASATICKGKLYLLGGYDRNGKTKSVLVCSVFDLIKSSQHIPTGFTRIFKAAERRADQTQVWQKVADAPMCRSTCVTINEQLIAIGGFEDAHTSFSSTVYRYNLEANLWEGISQMKLPRQKCMAVTLPRDRLMVVGGWCNESEDTDSVEFATIKLED